MGKTSRPVHIILHQSIKDATPERWALLESQGNTIGVLPDIEPDILLAPYAMRMTADMMKQLPNAFELALKGARALKAGPTGDDTTWKAGKEKRASNKGKNKGKNSKKQAQAPASGEPPVEAAAPGEGEQPREASHVEGNG